MNVAIVKKLSFHFGGEKWKQIDRKTRHVHLDFQIITGFQRVQAKTD